MLKPCVLACLCTISCCSWLKSETWFVPLLCLLLLIYAVTSPGFVPCVQSPKGSVCGCRYVLCHGHLYSWPACTSKAASPLCPQQDGPLGDHCVVQSLPMSVSDLWWCHGLCCCGSWRSLANGFRLIFYRCLLKCFVSVREKLVLLPHISLQHGSKNPRLWQRLWTKAGKFDGNSPYLWLWAWKTVDKVQRRETDKDKSILRKR